MLLHKTGCCRVPLQDGSTVHHIEQCQLLVAPSCSLVIVNAITQDLLQHMTEACDFIKRMRSSSFERPASSLFTDAEGRTSETVAFGNFLKSIDFEEQIRLALVERPELSMYAGEQALETLANAEADTSKNANHIEHLPSSEQEAKRIPETIAARETHTSNNVILVHCDVGVSRSATIMIGYLMRKHCIPLFDALAMVKEKRRIKPNSNFIEQLKVWEDTGYEVYENVETKAPKLQYQEYLDRRAERLKEKGLMGNEPIVPLAWEDLDMMSKSARKKRSPESDVDTPCSDLASAGDQV